MRLLDRLAGHDGPQCWDPRREETVRERALEFEQPPQRGSAAQKRSWQRNQVENAEREFGE